MPGYRLLTPVGFGAGGAVWSARDGAGRPVAVSFVALPAGERGSATLRRLGALRSGIHPHLPRVLDVVGLAQGRCALVTEVVAGPTLATVHAARGGLPAPELATLLGALGSALGYLHDRGIIHGDVAPRNVIIAAGGVPVLVDLVGEVSHEKGTAGFVAPERARGAPASRAADVWALGQVLRWAAAPDTGARLVEAALAEHPAARPGARDLAAMAPGLADAAEIVLPDDADLAQAQLRAGAGTTPTELARTRRPRRRHRRTGRRVAVGTAVVALLIGTGAAVLAVGGEDDDAPLAAAEASAVAADLLQRRDAALMDADAAALADLTVPGSAAAEADAALLARLRGSGLRVDGLETGAVEVEVVRHGPGPEVVVDVVSHQGPYVLVPADAAPDPDVPSTPVAPQGDRCVRLVLAGPAPWRVSSTGPCGE
ncbi:protein kinase domain-containing protein [Georgenia subflava]|uniref:protein kinase domain-containing protein n=1 Tax=Georgenia subflava TaxID=1622177 RepID=UPI00186AD97E|nr:protein kinase [Georgenia subflava]